MERRAAMRCPVCSQAVNSVAPRPFCSERCRSADLARWLGGAYRIAGEPVDPAAHLSREIALEGDAPADGAKE